jgi:hypothetical protein
MPSQALPLERSEVANFVLTLIKESTSPQTHVLSCLSHSMVYQGPLKREHAFIPDCFKIMPRGVVPLTSALLNLPKGKSLGRSKHATNS